MGLKVIDDDYIKLNPMKTIQQLTFKKLKLCIIASVLSIFLVTSLNLGLAERSFSFFKQTYLKTLDFDLFYNTPQEHVNIDIIMTSTNTIPQIKHSFADTNLLDKSFEDKIAFQFGKYFKLKPKIIS